MKVSERLAASLAQHRFLAGEQFSTAFFSTEDKIYIAQQLDAIGVEYIGDSFAASRFLHSFNLAIDFFQSW